MKTAQIKQNQNGELYIDGDFKFDLSNPVVINDEQQPVKKISFDWCLEAPKGNYELMYQMMGEKLKEDFLNLLESLK
jgi:hypothetical protein